nr:hypothetical protein [uncultured Desulfuromonas sp.]
MLKKIVCSAVFCVLMVSLAQASVYEQRPDRDAFEAALKSCMEEAGKDEQGHPDRKAVDACMENKGFKKPEGGPGGPGGPPPRD